MKLPTKLPANMDEAKVMIKDLSDQIVQKVTELCNKAGKKLDEPPAAPTEEKKADPPAEEKPAEKKE